MYRGSWKLIQIFLYRTGYLVDTFATRIIFEKLLVALREKNPLFKDVVHLYEPTADQSFFINVPRFHFRAPEFNDTIYVSVSGYLISPPENVLNTLQSIEIRATDISCTLPSDLPVDVTVPLAAVLLEYPIAYVPHGAILPERQSLDVYECTLSGGVTIVKFSCPSSLVSREIITQSLRLRFGMDVEVMCMSETVDRLIL
ncbi:uncharacterized protein BT62DRAFT_932914 [Guyanagaster necrorhizus]|uniref:Uncharacterized protein n=1 Tax=Guyanagaster necrorhizus TaxID=856835 RepID=A0A9P7VSB4_9AGAR|nr:uncharacterized protein BT62DRAFT_932914 [Guyanagaster necrorhizus MCA 3950]KAG7445748.1 hypothetical protein BT62DRAFT_932914 [Guyanagaster necrorhizus MCA 3950]